MGGRRPIWLFGVTVVAEIAAIVLSWRLEPVYDTLLYGLFNVATVGAGAVIARRRPENVIGWLFCGFGLLNALTSDLAQGWGLRAAAEGWAGGAIGEGISAVSWLPNGFGWTLTFLLFPTGHLPSRRWRVVAWVGAVGLVISMTAWGLSPSRGRDFASGRNPWAVASLPTGLLLAVGMPLFLGALVAAVASLAWRFRRSTGLERQQLKWFVLAAVIAGIALPTSFVLWYITPAAGIIAAFALTCLPLAAGAAILRYRLYDIDFFISRTVAYATLTILLAASYAVLIVALGAFIGRASPWTVAVATLVCTLLFRPLRARVQDLVDRRFNRSRYDALHRMAAFLSDVRAGHRPPEDVRDVLAQILGDPTLALLLYLPESRHYVDLTGHEQRDTATPGRHRIVIERGDQPIGVVLHDGTSALGPDLLRRVVEDGGLAIEIARLRAELNVQLTEVKSSRARIVAAAHAERRRIERDLHDGAQQRLVSIGLALRHAQHQLTTASPTQVRATVNSTPADDGARMYGARADSAPVDGTRVDGAVVDSASADRGLQGAVAAEVRATLEGAVAEATIAIGELRELARGLPPAQLDAGLGPACRELARRAPLPVSVEMPDTRFDTAIEAAAYFICSEGLTNAIKHANATQVTLTAVQNHNHLTVRVTDNGTGGATMNPTPTNPAAQNLAESTPGTGLTGLADRVAALGGTFHLQSHPTTGTTLTAELPCA
ncbi:ATP-binding protein [Kribbella sp. NPDC026611]|uniref:sensor histidine kinase n=1 Tax=Kribbella sp. NPDC026611 TaxID=3154911 RepID=UPI0033BFCF44